MIPILISIFWFAILMVISATKNVYLCFVALIPLIPHLKQPININYKAIIIALLLKLSIHLFPTETQTLVITPFLVAYALISAPIIEEIIYREYLQSIFKNQYLGMLVVAIIFSLTHAPATLLTFMQYVGHSLLYSFVYMKSDRDVRAPIVLHILYNASVLIGS